MFSLEHIFMQLNTHYQDTALLDCIKLQNLLNTTQEKLALVTQLTTTPVGALLV